MIVVAVLAVVVAAVLIFSSAHSASTARFYSRSIETVKTYSPSELAPSNQLCREIAKLAFAAKLEEHCRVEIALSPEAFSALASNPYYLTHAPASAANAGETLLYGFRTRMRSADNLVDRNYLVRAYPDLIEKGDSYDARIPRQHRGKSRQDRRSKAWLSATTQ